jgi:hypothetical protein
MKQYGVVPNAERIYTGSVSENGGGSAYWRQTGEGWMMGRMKSRGRRTG